MTPDLVAQIRAIASRGRMDDADVQIIFDAADEIERLARWKAEATQVLDDWTQVWIAANRPGEIGSSTAKGMLRWVEFVMDLWKRNRTEITRLEAEIELLRSELAEAHHDS